MINQKDVAKLYNSMERPTLQRVADVFGVSRERIRQILNKQKIDTAKKHIVLEGNCPICKRPFKDVNGVNIKKGICLACAEYNSYKGKVRYIRTISYPKYCKYCGRELKKSKRIKGQCMTCYKRTYKNYKSKDYKERAKKHRVFFTKIKKD